MADKNHIQIVIDAKDKFSKAFGSLSSGIADVGKAAGTVFGGIAAAGTAAGSGLYAMTASTAKAYDSVAKLSSRLGVSTEFLTEYHYAADLCGVSSQEFNNSLQYMIRNVGEASQGVGAAKDAFKMLGLSIDEIKKMSPEQQFETITQALEGVKSANDRVSIAMDIFGRSGAGVIQMVNAGSASLAEYRKEAGKYGVSLSGPAGKAAEDFIDSQARMKTAFTGVKNTISEALMPTITTLSTKFASWIGDVRESKIRDYFEELGKKLEGVNWEGVAGRMGEIATAVGKIATAAGTALTAITSLGTTLGKTFIENTEGLTNNELKLKDLNKELEKLQEKRGRNFLYPHEIRDLDDAIVKTKELIAQQKESIKADEEKIAKMHERTKAKTPEVTQTPEETDAAVKAKAEAAAAAAAAAEQDRIAKALAAARAKAAAEERLAIEKATIEEIKAAHADYYMTQEQQLDTWFASQLEKLGENKKAQEELEQLYREKKAELHEEDLLAETENTELARQRLIDWYEEQEALYRDNKSKMAEINAKYLQQKAKIEDKEQKNELAQRQKQDEALYRMQQVFGIKGFNLVKLFRIKETIANTKSAAMGAYNALAPIPIVGPALGAAAAAAAIVYGMQQVADIQGQSVGAAHGGLTNVPNESTYLLQKGERVLSPNQNRDLTDALNGGGMGGNISMGDVNIFVQTAGKEDLMNMKERDWEEIMNEGFFPALNKVFSLRGQNA